MANFGHKPKKPGSVPGAASGGKEKRAEARVRGVVQRAVRAQAAGRAGRAQRNGRSGR